VLTSSDYSSTISTASISITQMVGKEVGQQHLNENRANHFHNTCSISTLSVHKTFKLYFFTSTPISCRSEWPRGLRRRTTAARLLRSWVRIDSGYCADESEGSLHAGPHVVTKDTICAPLPFGTLVAHGTALPDTTGLRSAPYVCDCMFSLAGGNISRTAVDITSSKRRGGMGFAGGSC
jgi:hypothetical protein